MEPTGSSVPFREVRRGHVADDVFDQLAAAIVRGELPPDSVLPPERILVERFGVSRVSARHAVHRLAELGLVRVRQGGATVVLDPAEATDLGVLALFYRHAPRGAETGITQADIIEKQYMQGLSIVEVASRRAPKKALTELLVWVDSEARGLAADVAAFEEQFWRRLATASKNRIFQVELGWWYRALPERPVPDGVAKAPSAHRFGFCREVLRRLVEDDGPVDYYLATVRPLLAALFPGETAVSRLRARKLPKPRA